MVPPRGIEREGTTITTTEYQVTGRHGEMSVRDEVSRVGGIEAIDVRAATGRLVVTSSAPLDDDAVLAFSSVFVVGNILRLRTFTSQAGGSTPAPSTLRRASQPVGV